MKLWRTKNCAIFGAPGMLTFTKILRRLSQGNPRRGGGKGLKATGVTNIAILDLSKAISRKRCKIAYFAYGSCFLTIRDWPKSTQVSLIASTLRAFQWAQDEHRTLSLPPRGGSKKQSVQNLNNKLRYLRNGTRSKIGCQLLLITNRKSGFRLVPTSMTLDDLERRDDPYFAFFRRFWFCWPNTPQWLNTDLYCP